MSPTNPFSLSLKRPNRSLISVLIAWPPPRSKPLRPTAWLDGLRGVAAFEVFIFHYVDIWFHGDAGYGAGPEYMQFYRLPLIRSLWHSGRTMVCMFFMISGYVLTQKSLLLLRRRQNEAMFTTLSSAIFRRGIRLIPPSLVACCMGFIMVRLGYRGDKDNAWLPYFDSITEQAWHFFVETLRYLNFFGWNPRSFGSDLMHKYEAVVWTVPMEFTGSMAIFLVLMGTARLQPSMRISFVGLLALTALLQGCWTIFCFFCGIILADHQLYEDAANASPSEALLSPAWRTIIWSAVLLQGLWLAGAPMRGPWEGGDKALGFNTIWRIMPEQYGSVNVSSTVWSIAGLLIIASATRLTYMKKVLETTFCQYLGKISFALYLNHIWTRDLPGTALRTLLEGICGDSSTGFVFALVTWLALMTMFNFMVAGLFEWTVDAPLIRFAHAFEGYCLQLGKDRANTVVASVNASHGIRSDERGADLENNLELKRPDP